MSKVPRAELVQHIREEYSRMGNWYAALAELYDQPMKGTFRRLLEEAGLGDVIEGMEISQDKQRRLLERIAEGAL